MRLARPNYDQQSLKVSGYENSYTIKVSYAVNVIYFSLSHDLLHEHSKGHSNHPTLSFKTFTRHELIDNLQCLNFTMKKVFQAALHQW